jgi:cytoskeletal protein CcmA (bactofilin family)
MSVFKRDRDPYRSTPVQSPVKSTPASPPAPAAWETPSAPATSAAAPSTESETNRAPAPAPVLQRDSAAVVDKNSELSGKLHSKGNVLIEGVFQGEVEAQGTVLVERDALTEAKLCANDVIVSGSFDGEIECQHRLQITATASIKGEINTPILVVEDGSTVNCRFKMTRTER